MQRKSDSHISWFDTLLNNLLTEHTWSEVLEETIHLSQDLFSPKFKINKLTTGVKLSILQQTHLRIINHTEIAKKCKVSPVLMFAQIEHILIGSILVAMKLDEDRYPVHNGFSTDYWNNVNPNFKLAMLNKIERQHLNLCNHAVALTPQKLAPIFEHYADKETLNLLALELAEHRYEIFQHHEGNDILNMVNTLLYNRIRSEKIVKSDKNTNSQSITYPDKIGSAYQICSANKFRPNHIASGVINANADFLSDKAWKRILKSTTADLRKRINSKHYLSFWHHQFTICANIIVKNKIININTGDDDAFLVLIKPASNRTNDQPVMHDLNDNSSITTIPIKENVNGFMITANDELLKAYKKGAKKSNSTTAKLISNTVHSLKHETPNEIALQLVSNNHLEKSVNDNFSVTVTPITMDNALPIYAAMFNGPASSLLSQLFHDCLEENIATVLEQAIDGQHDLQAITPPLPQRGLYLW